MRSIILLGLAFVSSACSGPAPAGIGSDSVPTAIVIVHTVVVTAVETAAGASPTVSATSTLLPVSPAATLAATLAGTSALATGEPLTIPASFYGPVFTNITVSTNTFSLRCPPKEITIDAITGDSRVTQVDMYIRVRDKHSEDIPNWSWSRTFETDGQSNFWVTLKGEDVPPDLRKAQGWFDFQLIGIGKNRAVLGRTEKIKDQVSYTIDC